MRQNMPINVPIQGKSRQDFKAPWNFWAPDTDRRLISGFMNENRHDREIGISFLLLLITVFMAIHCNWIKSMEITQPIQSG